MTLFKQLDFMFSLSNLLFLTSSCIIRKEKNGKFVVLMSYRQILGAPIIMSGLQLKLFANTLNGEQFGGCIPIGALQTNQVAQPTSINGRWNTYGDFVDCLTKL